MDGFIAKYSLYREQKAESDVVAASSSIHQFIVVP